MSTILIPSEAPETTLLKLVESGLVVKSFVKQVDLSGIPTMEQHCWAAVPRILFKTPTWHH